MQQLSCTGLGRVEWLEVPEPRLASSTAALIRPLAVARCDIDRIQITRIPFPEPYALGHECVAEVVEIGDAVRDVRVGQRVVVPYQISCGHCRTCALGYTASCEVEHGACMYGMRPFSEREFGGMLCDRVLVPYADAMCVALPDDLAPTDAAALADNATMGYGAVVEPLRRHPGAEVAVISDGSPSVPLFAAQAALALGAGRVDLLSRSREELELAERLGVTPVETDFRSRAARYPVVLDGGGMSVDTLRYALLSTDVGGVCVNVGPLVGPTQDASLPLGALYGRGIRFHCGAIHTRTHLPGALGLVRAGRLRPRDVTTRVVARPDAAAAYVDPAIKLVVDFEA